MKREFKGKSGKLYIRNGSSDEKHYFSVYSGSPYCLANWIGTVTRMQARHDCDIEPLQILQQLTLQTPEGRFAYAVNQFGEMEDGTDVTEIILQAQEKHGFENIKIERENVLQ